MGGEFIFFILFFAKCTSLDGLLKKKEPKKTLGLFQLRILNEEFRIEFDSFLNAGILILDLMGERNWMRRWGVDLDEL
ncbi:MAG: hypothetical protein ACI9G9_000699 [Psychromonas sp.]|jgi:hypothetical protein